MTCSSLDRTKTTSTLIKFMKQHIHLASHKSEQTNVRTQRVESKSFVSFSGVQGSPLMIGDHVLRNMLKCSSYRLIIDILLFRFFAQLNRYDGPDPTNPANPIDLKELDDPTKPVTISERSVPADSKHRNKPTVLDPTEPTDPVEGIRTNQLSPPGRPD